MRQLRKVSPIESPAPGSEKKNRNSSQEAKKTFPRVHPHSATTSIPPALRGRNGGKNGEKPFSTAPCPQRYIVRNREPIRTSQSLTEDTCQNPKENIPKDKIIRGGGRRSNTTDKSNILVVETTSGRIRRPDTLELPCQAGDDLSRNDVDQCDAPLFRLRQAPSWSDIIDQCDSLLADLKRPWYQEQKEPWSDIRSRTKKILSQVRGLTDRPLQKRAESSNVAQTHQSPPAEVSKQITRTSSSESLHLSRLFNELPHEATSGDHLQVSNRLELPKTEATQTYSEESKSHLENIIQPLVQNKDETASPIKSVPPSEVAARQEPIKPKQQKWYHKLWSGLKWVFCCCCPSFKSNPSTTK